MSDVSPVLTIEEPAAAFFQCTDSPWLMLTCLPKFGLRRRHAVASVMPDLSGLLAANAATLNAMGLPREIIEPVQAWQQQDCGHPVVARARAIRNACQAQGIWLLTRGDADYPEPLRHIHDAPWCSIARAAARFCSVTRSVLSAAATPPARASITPAGSHRL